MRYPVCSRESFWAETTRSVFSIDGLTDAALGRAQEPKCAITHSNKCKYKNSSLRHRCAHEVVRERSRRIGMNGGIWVPQYNYVLFRDCGHNPESEGLSAGSKNWPISWHVTVTWTRTEHTGITSYVCLLRANHFNECKAGTECDRSFRRRPEDAIAWHVCSCAAYMSSTLPWQFSRKYRQQ